MKRYIILFFLLIPLIFLSGESKVSDKTGEIFLLNYRGKMFNRSSELEDPGMGKIGKYAVGNIIDKNISTAWVEGVKGDGIGEYVLLASKEIPGTISIYSGYSKNISLFNKNNRPSKLKVSLYFGMADSWGGEYGDYYRVVKYPEDYFLLLKDTIHLQTFNFPFKDNKELSAFRDRSLEVLKKLGRKKGVPPFPGPPDTKWIVKLEIAGVYRGSKWQDTCISEVFFNDRYISDVHSYKYVNVQKVNENEEGDKIIMTAGNTAGSAGGKEKSVILYESPDKSAVFYVEDVSKDREWVTVLKQTWKKGAPHAETSYLIFNTFLGQEMKEGLEKVIGSKISGPFSLNYRADVLTLSFYFTGTNKQGRIELK